MGAWATVQLKGMGGGLICAVIWLTLDYLTGWTSPKPSHDFFTIVFAFAAGFASRG
jgi:hypothetical protein